MTANTGVKRVSLEVRNLFLCKVIQREGVPPSLADNAHNMRGISDDGGINAAVGVQVIGKGTNWEVDKPGVGSM